MLEQKAQNKLMLGKKIVFVSFVELFIASLRLIQDLECVRDNTVRRCFCV